MSTETPRGPAGSPEASRAAHRDDAYALAERMALQIGSESFPALMLATTKLQAAVIAAHVAADRREHVIEGLIKGLRHALREQDALPASSIAECVQ